MWGRGIIQPLECLNKTTGRGEIFPVCFLPASLGWDISSHILQPFDWETGFNTTWVGPPGSQASRLRLLILLAFLDLEFADIRS